MFSQRNSVAHMQKVSFCFVREALRARKFFAGLHPGIFTERAAQAAKRISALPPPRAACALPRG
jgi:hypothetical protein